MCESDASNLFCALSYFAECLLRTLVRLNKEVLEWLEIRGLGCYE